MTKGWEQSYTPPNPVAPVSNPQRQKYPPRPDGRVQRAKPAPPGTSLAKHIETRREAGREVHLLTKERQKLHDAIAERFLAGIQPPQGRAPLYTFMGGGTASGKSTVVDSGNLTDWPQTRKPGDDVSPANAVMIDSDAVKRMLPEFDTYSPSSGSAAHTHNESYMIAQRISDMAIERGLDVVYDGVGVTDMDKKISKLRRAGYQLRGVYVTSSVATARKRNQERFRTTGRNVPDDILRRSHSQASALTPRLAPQFDQWELWESETSPVKIAEASGGSGITVLDSSKYAEFVRKAGA